ncbi:fatty acyl-CoA reductase 2, chloroplastic-like isoform X2 [Apium graveolens]|uniref:fatty acyl-CoA reductase 2, chloroplastic-like isoform X2 n=1 Tax=Apium graveolens TaxID=4045 RepID=UPI003D7B9EFA
MSALMLSMRATLPNMYHISSRQNLNINKVSTESLLGNKMTSTTTTVFCRHENLQIPKHISSGQNGKISATVDTESVSINGQLSSKRHDGLGIIEFFGGKKLLITGATGFLAKVLVEKILRTLPEVDKIFLLIKAKNEEAATERLMNEIVNTELFKCLREKHGTLFEKFILSKLVPVVGNMSETNIAREVDLIINSAATTTFDERPDIALDINTRGAARIVNFAKNCENLKLYVHVSTAYACRQSEGEIIEESLGKGHYVASNADISEAQHKHIHGMDIEAEIKLVSEIKDSFEKNEIDQKLEDFGMRRAQKYGWPNTYSFTKAMGEMVVEDTKGEMPVIILRPSVITSTSEEPFSGWIEGNRMMDPFFLWYGKGKLPGFYSSPDTIADMVPADIVVNSTLAAIAKHGCEKATPGDDHVYHITSSVAHPLMARDLLDLAYQHFSLSPCFDRKGNPIQISAFKFFTSIQDLLSDMQKTNGSTEISPRQELIRRKTEEHLKYLANLYQPYTFYTGRFDNSNVEELMKCLSEEERQVFGFDVGSIDWKDYVINVHFPGIRKHIMKERMLK